MSVEFLLLKLSTLVYPLSHIKNIYIYVSPLLALVISDAACTLLGSFCLRQFPGGGERQRVSPRQKHRSGPLQLQAERNTLCG